MLQNTERQTMTGGKLEVIAKDKFCNLSIYHAF